MARLALTELHKWAGMWAGLMCLIKKCGCVGGANMVYFFKMGGDNICFILKVGGD